ncbi:MAG: hypothetical protein PHT54_00705 [Candidatus Nanoarchaeia archaeon]|nr:hypothetical protein [Candidatus Nanoarchaeia archaeon]
MLREVLFWCEFPKETNWDLINKEINFKTEIYIAASSREEFLEYKKRIKNKNITIGAWPTLSKKEGYWFSGFSERKSIDKLDDFKDFNIKIDIEPPIFNGKMTALKVLKWAIKPIFKKAENKNYLADKINRLKNKKIIISPRLPRFYMKKLVGNVKDRKNIYYSHIFYTSMLSKPMVPLLKLFYKSWFKKENNPKFYVALGCLNVGVFQNEGIYKSISEFKKDIEFMKKINIDKIVVFHLGGLFNKKDYKEWLNLIRKNLSC